MCPAPEYVYEVVITQDDSLQLRPIDERDPLSQSQCSAMPNTNPTDFLINVTQVDADQISLNIKREKLAQEVFEPYSDDVEFIPNNEDSIVTIEDTTMDDNLLEQIMNNDSETGNTLTNLENRLFNPQNITSAPDNLTIGADESQIQDIEPNSNRNIQEYEQHKKNKENGNLVTALAKVDRPIRNTYDPLNIQYLNIPPAPQTSNNNTNSAGDTETETSRYVIEDVMSPPSKSASNSNSLALMLNTDNSVFASSQLKTPEPIKEKVNKQ